MHLAGSPSDDNHISLFLDPLGYKGRGWLALAPNQGSQAAGLSALDGCSGRARIAGKWEGGQEVWVGGAHAALASAERAAALQGYEG